MSFVITLRQYIPPPRFDNIPWVTARIEEGPTVDGPWTVIASIDLDPIDDDLTAPMARDLQTDQATFDSGAWYRVIWVDAADGEQPTDPLYDAPTDTRPYLPTVVEVASLIRQRTKDSQGRELGNFTDTTRPTYTQAYNLIESATNRVVSLVDNDNIPVAGEVFLKDAIMFRAASLIELSFYAEQVNTGRSVYEQLNEDYLSAMKNLAEIIEREREQEDPNAPSLTAAVRWNFPPVPKSPVWEDEYSAP